MGVRSVRELEVEEEAEEGKEEEEERRKRRARRKSRRRRIEREKVERERTIGGLLNAEEGAEGGHREVMVWTRHLHDLFQTISGVKSHPD
ncbi:hypothetical protein E2C01_031136 [Portunus trituberculatus]|uniref:Uncharacterized protein n=1 Tax=Portunus trituberculatus TaxID=210409 RepID=A0A5B7EXA3_PORTR|nr:hypothetical protein [Portunus trituberculatus]